MVTPEENYQGSSMTYKKTIEAVLYIPESSRGINIRDCKGHGEVSPVPIMTIRSNYHTMGSTSHVWNEYTIL